MRYLHLSPTRPYVHVNTEIEEIPNLQLDGPSVIDACSTAEMPLVDLCVPQHQFEIL